MLARVLLIAAILAVGCKRSNPDSASADALRFLPAAADKAVRVDVARAKTWPSWPKVAAGAFRPIASPLAAVKTACGLDLVGDASSFVFGRHGGDVTIVIGGLPKDKLTACPAKVGASVPGLSIVPDGERFGIMANATLTASGAILANGDLVIVSRNSAGIEPGAWKTELASTSGAAPAWWGELDQTHPLAVRVASADRTVTGSAELGDPLVVHAKMMSATPELATTDQARLKAIVDFLTKAEAGTGRVEPKGTTAFADFTATGPQIEKLVAAGMSTLGPEPATQEPPTGLDTSPIECSALAPAVATYVKTTVEAMPADQAAQMQTMIERLVPALQKAYVESCTADAWAPAAIHCHVDSATNVPRFEKCRLVLAAEQRTKFDELLKAALSGH